MRRLLLACSMSVAFAVAASAQTPPPAPAGQGAPPAPEKKLHFFPSLPEAPVDQHRRQVARGQLFVAPSGEPFRAEPGQPYPSRAWFDRADANHDGKLDRHEFEADFRRFFDILDVDHDLRVDAMEIGRYERELVPEILTGDAFPFPGGGRRGGPRGGPPPGGPPPGGPPHFSLTGGGGQDIPVTQGDGSTRAPDQPISGAGLYSLINIPEPVAAMDANLDGSVSLAENRAAADRRFQLLDFDQRGYLTFDDLPRPPIQRGGLFGRR